MLNCGIVKFLAIVAEYHDLCPGQVMPLGEGGLYKRRGERGALALKGVNLPLLARLT